MPNGVRLFVNAQAGEYLPAVGSPIIDTAINKLDERPSLTALRLGSGFAESRMCWLPSTILVGQLRADDPSVSPPGGIGQNIFKDRGALERADFIGPAAILLDPIDNDALGIDRDGSDLRGAAQLGGLSSSSVFNWPTAMNRPILATGNRSRRQYGRQLRIIPR